MTPGLRHARDRAIGALPAPARDALRVVYWRWRNRFGVAYEPECEHVVRLVAPGDRVVDVGTNMGQYAWRLAARVGPAGRVFAFEAARATYEVAARILRHAAVELQHAAIGEHAGMVTLASYETPGRRINSGVARIVGAADARAASTEQVRCTTLDEAVPASGKPIAFIKCDVEGHEVQVVRGGRRLFERDQPTLLVEIERGENFTGIMELLAPRGYEPFQLAGVQWRRLAGFEQRWTNNFLWVPPARRHLVAGR